LEISYLASFLHLRRGERGKKTDQNQRDGKNESLNTESGQGEKGSAEGGSREANIETQPQSLLLRAKSRAKAEAGVVEKEKGVKNSGKVKQRKKKIWERWVSPSSNLCSFSQQWAYVEKGP